MTVAALWSALDEANSGTPVGLEDFSLRGRGDKPDDQTILAVDLSIWVCEGLASTALSSFHSDPALHLVYQRTTKLLTLGLGLVFVSEGKRRVRSQEATSSSTQAHELKHRRSGSLFWSASQRCEKLLQCIGVPVVRAEAEGEALCALLNAQGLADGVISNDGDCFLFGAKTVYKDFTAENLDARQVMRYDADKLAANLDGGSSSRTLKLSREDLIAFAMLTGSDLVGVGANYVGHRKAIQCLHAIRSLNHPCNARTCLDKLLSWNEAATKAAKPADSHVDVDDDGPSTISTRCCSICLHPGNKLSHEKNGCAECGTEPGEGCFVVTSSEKFLRALKEKALGWLAPRHIVNGYFEPNSNAVPPVLSSLKTKPYTINVDAAKLFAMDSDSMLIKGRSRQTSLEHLHSTLPKLMARLELWDARPRNVYAATSKLAYKPIPISINKCLVKQSRPCYEITWSWSMSIPRSPSEVQFCTVECQSLINSKFPQLVKAFHQEERRRQQGRNHDARHKHFVGAMESYVNRSQEHQRRDFSKPQQGGGRQRKKRERNFDAERVRKAQKTSAGQAPSHDVSLLMDHLPSEELLSDATYLKPEAVDEPIKQEAELGGVDVELLQGEAVLGDVGVELLKEEPVGGMADVASIAHTKLGDEEEHWYSQQALLCEDDTFVPTNREDPISYSDDLLHSNDLFQQDTFGLGDQDFCRPLPALKSYEDDQPFPLLQQPFSEDDLDMNEQLFPQEAAYGGYANRGRCSIDRDGKGAHLTPSTRLYCDMGILQIEVTPLKSRRWRLF